MPFLRTESPATAHVFRCTRWTRVTYCVGLAGALTLVAALLLVPGLAFERWYVNVLAAAAFVAYAVDCWLGLVRSRDVYVLFEDGIVRRTPGRAEQSVLWTEVAGVRERRALHRLELLNAGGERLLALDCAVAEIGRLRRLVQERTAPFRAAPEAEAGVGEAAEAQPAVVAGSAGEP